MVSPNQLHNDCLPSDYNNIFDDKLQLGRRSPAIDVIQPQRITAKTGLSALDKPKVE